MAMAMNREARKKFSRKETHRAALAGCTSKSKKMAACLAGSE
jgi:hypothetical protein